MMLTPGCLTETLSPATSGSASIVHDSPDLLTRLRASRDGQPLRADKYTRLLINGSVWMTDAEWECATNRPFLHRASGDVLIAGLGLGLVLRPILAKPRVKSVTVLEINPDVIALVAQHYLDSEKLVITKADAFKWRTKRTFDVIYFDIWSNVPNEDDAPAISRLKKRYAKNLRRGGWMGAWCEEFAR